MKRYLDPKNDLIFKRIFGEHKHLCKSLLNSMLPLDDSQQIVELEYLPPELTPDIPALKDSIVDVRCIDNRKRQFIVEMQMQWTDSFKSRVLFNASKAYVRQLKPKQDYKLLQPVYALSFVDEVFDDDPATYYHHYKIVNIENTDKRIDGLEFVFIELPKYHPGSRAERKLYDLWLTFLTQLNESNEVPPALLEEELTKEAVEYLESSSYSEDELDIYDRYWDSVRTQRTLYIGAIDEGLAKGRAEGLAKGRAEGIAKGEAIGIEKGMAKGMAKGEAIGIEKGIAKGRAEGEAIGRAEGIAKGRAEGEALILQKVVMNAHRAGKSVSDIAAFTGLSEDEVRDMLHKFAS